MFTYDVAVTFILDHCSITTGIQLVSDSSDDFEIDDDMAIEVARDMLERDGLEIPEPIGIDVEVQGVYGGQLPSDLYYIP